MVGLELKCRSLERGKVTVSGEVMGEEMGESQDAFLGTRNVILPSPSATSCSLPWVSCSVLFGRRRRVAQCGARTVTTVEDNMAAGRAGVSMASELFWFTTLTG